MLTSFSLERLIVENENHMPTYCIQNSILCKILRNKKDFYKNWKIYKYLLIRMTSWFSSLAETVTFHIKLECHPFLTFKSMVLSWPLHTFDRYWGIPIKNLPLFCFLYMYWSLVSLRLWLSQMFVRYDREWSWGGGRGRFNSVQIHDGWVSPG